MIVVMIALMIAMMIAMRFVTIVMVVGECSHSKRWLCLIVASVMQIGRLRMACDSHEILTFHWWFSYWGQFSRISLQIQLAYTGARSFEGIAGYGSQPRETIISVMLFFDEKMAFYGGYKWRTLLWKFFNRIQHQNATQYDTLM